MKNYIVWADCKIAETQPAHNIEPAGAKGVAESYHSMLEISQVTARQYIAGPWSAQVLDEPCATRIEMFQKNWKFIRDLWHKEPCNILWLDSDTVVMQPTEIFGSWTEFRLFNWTDPKRSNQFENYFNSGVRYYPATMSADTWTLGESLANCWDATIWDYEQQIFNHMFWSQGIDLDHAHQPQFNWQTAQGTAIHEVDLWHEFNQLPRTQAHIIHYHGTRGHLRGRWLAQLLKSHTHDGNL